MFLCKFAVRQKWVKVYQIEDEEVVYEKGQTRIRKRTARAWSHRWGASAIAQNASVAEMMAKQQAQL